ncbi:MAG TPA: hypothetical protein RMH85_09690 [Polyangiaceae bacterium LLY-WYZ-15_(1-7)]|nr:hypothetical protein [Sandaracinus sp.]HJL01763.1 hypothetical protein [Polyangiaceae bacterium LLY-WYZ-15_(1-7)]HJL08760.1 hypothetical protein [Polyangiaceae bacterium LLY-WYZ-15_(1-7)]HJL23699.1 hypothetical protein [Polyangiaceae bacterium LLY-WYZ-15_(1-7)]HJL47581.1 hypothetical protein [Polyangiaceae bacterium LLY-WYZ-15_(1-7)]
MRPTTTLSLALFALAACRGGGAPMGPGEGPPPEPPGECAPVEEAPRAEPLQWKRAAAFEADLHAALELDRSSGCREVDRVPCGAVHLVALGGNDPLGIAQYEPVAEPLATTPLTVDRMVLGACANRVALDAEGAPRVFDRVDLGAAALAPADPAVRAQTEALYRRLLRRDATDEELAIVAELAEGLSARDWALAACFAIGTTTENVLF